MPKEHVVTLTVPRYRVPANLFIKNGVVRGVAGLIRKRVTQNTSCDRINTPKAWPG